MDDELKYRWEVYYRTSSGREISVSNGKVYTDFSKCDRDMCDKASDLEESGREGVSGDIFTYEYGVWRRGR